MPITKKNYFCRRSENQAVAYYFAKMVYPELTLFRVYLPLIAYEMYVKGRKSIRRKGQYDLAILWVLAQEMGQLVGRADSIF